MTWASSQEIAEQFDRETLIDSDGYPLEGHPDYADWLADLEAQHAAEIHAENAWLRAAEAGSPSDWAEEEYERQRELFYS